VSPVLSGMEIDPDSIDRDEISELGDGLLLNFSAPVEKEAIEACQVEER